MQKKEVADLKLVCILKLGHPKTPFNSFDLGRHKPILFFIYINVPMINKYAQFFAGLMNLEDAVTLTENRLQPSGAMD